jgi:hypothetical protein
MTTSKPPYRCVTGLASEIDRLHAMACELFAQTDLELSVWPWGFPAAGRNIDSNDLSSMDVVLVIRSLDVALHHDAVDN